MDVEENVVKIQKKLTKINSQGGSGKTRAVDLLKALQAMPLSLKMLIKTRIGLTVNIIRKSSTDREVIGVSKSLIKKWKKLLDECNGKETPSRTSDEPSCKEKVSKKPSCKENVSKEPSCKEKVSTPEALQKIKAKHQYHCRLPTSFPPRDPTDGIRSKCREMLAAALKPNSLEDAPEGSECVEKLAADLEDYIYQEFQNTKTRYKNRIRSRIANLNDSKNPQLKADFLAGVLPVSKLAVMTAEEMASEEMKELRTKLFKESMDDAQLATVQGTQTGLLKCGKCKKNNCTYNQVQTRSADEPMTTFALCNECGYRWKF